nr:PepSY-associated TM helix domain-containing protein [Shewanella saliphila]
MHIYISAAVFSLLIFFCVSGITLNHPSWSDSNETQVVEVELPQELIEKVQQQQELPLNAIQHFVEQKTGLHSPRNIDVLVDTAEITYDYPMPAGYTFVTVYVDDNLIEIEFRKDGFVSLINDLHKGRHSGMFWSGLIDISAILMLLFSLTGLFILLQNVKHRSNALVIFGLGTVAPILFYLLVVPRLSL